MKLDMLKAHLEAELMNTPAPDELLKPGWMCADFLDWFEIDRRAIGAFSIPGAANKRFICHYERGSSEGFYLVIACLITRRNGVEYIPIVTSKAIASDAQVAILMPACIKIGMRLIDQIEGA